MAIAKLDPNAKIEKKPYYTMAEAGPVIGLKYAALYNWMKRLNIKSIQFPGSTHRYIAAEDLELIREAKKYPYKIAELKKP